MNTKVNQAFTGGKLNVLDMHGNCILETNDGFTIEEIYGPGGTRVRTVVHVERIMGKNASKEKLLFIDALINDILRGSRDLSAADVTARTLIAIARMSFVMNIPDKSILEGIDLNKLFKDTVYVNDV